MLLWGQKRSSAVGVPYTDTQPKLKMQGEKEQGSPNAFCLKLAVWPQISSLPSKTSMWENNIYITKALEKLLNH